MKLPRIIAAFAALFASILWAAAGTNVLISAGSFWTYLDNGSNQGTNWAYPGFNDGTWSGGLAPLGYGNNESELGTVVSYGPNAANKYITTYFRQTFEVGDPEAFTTLRLNVRRDDGVAVYLNGVEVYRNNLVARAPYNSLATNAPDNGVVVFTTTVVPFWLVAGDNVLAAEVHQASVSDPDLRFDLELLGSTDPTTNNLPNVTISSPANNTFFIQPPSINIQASASDVDGTIFKVEFYRNGVKLGEDTNAPYSFLWANPPVGTHTLYARATDNLAGRTISGAVNITVGVSAPPVITSVIPPAGNVSNLTQVTVNFSEPVTGVQASDFLINGRPATTLVAGSTNFTFGFPPPKDGAVLVSWLGAHGIEDFEPNPRAFDNFAANASWQYTLTDRAAPTVARLNPVAGATVQSIDEVSVTFSEPVWGVDAADLLVNGAPTSGVSGSGAGPYRFSFNAISNGTVQLSWAANHGIKDFATTPNNFTGGSWSYTTDPSALFEGRIVINEIMYHPQSERTTEEYVELRNTGSGPVNLTGWRLNRGVDYVFPSISIPAGGYVVVAANVPAFTAKYGNVGTVVGPWEGSLNNGGEEIELEDALGNQVDLVHYSDEGDWSVRRRFSGNGWEWFSQHDGLGRSLELVNMRLDNSIAQNWAPSVPVNGTPGALNSVATNNAPPIISDVEHSPAIPKSTEPVTIKARVLDESIAGLTVSLRYRDVTAGTFSTAPMFDDGNHNDGGSADGIYAATIPALPVLTIVEFYVEATDSTGQRRTWPRQVGDGGAEPNAFYQVDDENYTGARPVYRLIMRPQDRADFFNFQDRVPRNATFITVEGSDVEIRYGCSVRRRGASSFFSTPPTFKLDIPRDRLWNGKSSMNMNSVSTWAQVLGSAIALKSGLAVAHARGVQLRFNGQNMSTAGSQMYGMYAAVEVLNDEWADDFFPDDGQGNVYSKRRPECAFEYRGTDPQAYINCAYDKESNASENDWSDLVKLLAALDPDTTSDADYVSAVKRNVNVEMWMRYFAVLHLMNYNETALVTGADDDYSMYRGIVDPRFLILPHDLDSIFGSQGVNNFTIYQPGSIGNINRLLRHPQFEPIYHDEFRRQLAGVFSTNELFQLMDQVLSDWAPGELANMKTIALSRRDSVISQLASALTVVRATVSGEPSSPTYVNGATLRVDGTDITTYRYRLNNGLLSAETAVGTPITLTGLASGTYTVFVIGKNSAGTWQSTNSPTSSKTWTVIPGLAGVMINEVLARNDSAVNYSNTFPDLIELYNARGTSIDLSGMRLSDDPAEPNKFTFPTNTTLAAGAYLRLFADDPNGTAGIHLGFSLDQDGEGVYLFDKAPNGGALIDSVEFGNQLPNLSIGRFPSGNWGLCTPTFGSANVASPTGNAATLAINEWLASGTFPFVDDFIEIYNPDSLPIDLGGYYLTDHPYGQRARHRIRALHFIPGFSYQAFLADGHPENGALHLDFQLASEGGEIALFAPDLTLIDCIYYAQQRTGVSQGRSPNGSERIVFLDQPTPGAGNPAPNQPTGGLVINEVLANNVSQTGADSTEPDWIELYNPTNAIVDLSGMSLSDQLSQPTRWVFPPNSRIPAFGYFRVNFDANSPTNATNTGFGLKATGDAVYLFNRPSAGGALLDSVTFGIQAPDFSLARVPNGGTNWVLGNPTLLAANIAATLGSPLRLKINEWLANPKPGNPDWFEIYNPEAQPVAIAGLHLSDKIGDLQQYQVPPRSFIGTGLRGFQIFYADGNTTQGANHVPFGLSASHDFIYLSDARAGIINDVEFSSQAEGVSEGLLPDGNTNVIVRFPTSSTPEESNYLPIDTVVVNEVLSHADDPFEDAIELRNLATTNVNIGGWYLSDSVTALKKFRIPDNTILSPNGFKVFYQNQFNPVPGDPGSFSLSAAHGDEVHLSAADERAVLTGYRGRVAFGPAENAVSFGRFPTSVDVQFVAMQSLTFGKDRPTNVLDFRSGAGRTNSSAKVGPLVISEIMYHPPDINGVLDNVIDEFIVLRNITAVPVQLFHPNFPTNHWRLRDAVKFDFPPNTSMAASTSVYIVSFDPVLSPSTLAAFRNKFRVPTNIAVLGPYEGKLDNSSDSVELVKPDAPEPASNEGPAVVPYILVDKVKYSDLPPWPLEPDGFGSVLRRINVNLFGNDPANWAAGDPRMPEPDSDGDGMPDSWENLYGLNPFSSADANLDRDSDGLTNVQEYLAGTNPNNPSSTLRLQISANSPVVLRLNALADKSYTIEYSAELSAPDWQPWAHIDSQSTPRILDFPAEPGFYRVRTPRLP